MSAIQSDVTRLETPERRDGAVAEASPANAAAAVAPASSAAVTNGAAAPAGKPWLRRVLMFGGMLVVAATSAAVYLLGGRYVGTDDAYIKAAQLSANSVFIEKVSKCAHGRSIPP